MKTLQTVGAVTVTLCAVLASSSCGFESSPGGPTNKDILDSTGLTVADAEMTIRDNMVAVSPRPADSYASPIDRGGCRTNESGMHDGPPWKLSVSNTFKSISPQDGEAVLARVDAMASRGYTIRTSDPAQNHSRYYKDKRGFEIGASYGNTESDTNVLYVTASSPCTAEDESTGIAVRTDAADIRATTRIIISVYNYGNWDALHKVSCGPLYDKIWKMRWGHLEWRDGQLAPYDESKIDKSLENERKTNFEARGNGWIVGIANIQWTDSDGKEDLITPSTATAEITIRYERHAEGLDGNNTARYRASYSDSRRSDATWHICALDPI
jgi:hypothetical protein